MSTSWDWTLILSTYEVLETAGIFGHEFLAYEEDFWMRSRGLCRANRCGDCPCAGKLG